jgi:hypothetical protein
MRHFLFVLALTAGCGTASDKSDSGKSETETQAPAATPASYTMLLDSAANLPACAATNEGQLVYLKTEAQFQACSAGAWAVVEIKGEKGDAGEAGVAGAAGEQGEAGAGMTLAAQYSCDGSSDLNADGAESTSGSDVSVVRFSSGDYFISCEDRFFSTTYTYADSTASSNFFAAASNGVQDGAIGCVAFYMTATFDIEAETVLWKINGESTGETVSCTKVVGS